MTKLHYLILLAASLFFNVLVMTKNHYLIIILGYTSARLLIDLVLLLISLKHDEWVKNFVTKIAKIPASVSWDTRLEGVGKWLMINFLILGACVEYLSIKTLV